MRKNIRGILTAALLVSLLLLCVSALPAAADDTGIITGAACGEGLTWQLDPATGELVISGEGAMADYSIAPPAPWYTHRDSITSVRLEEGVTTVGHYAFFYCEKITSVTLPDTLVSVNDFAFWNCTALTSVTLPEGVESVGGNAFQDCSALSDVSLPGSLTALGKDAFNRTALQKVLYNGTEEDWAEVNVGSNTNLIQALIFHPGHSFDQTVAEETYLASPATCVDAALYYKSCVCGEAGDETFPNGAPNGHRGGTASCTEQAVCETCGESWGDLLPHTPGDGPTCLEDQLCADCGTKLADRLGHDHKDKVTREPTCTDAGVRTYTCSRCDDTYDEPIDPKGHTEGVPATCETAQNCTVCDAVLVSPLGHDYKENTVEPTCTAQGYTAHVCSRCEHTYYDGFTTAKGHVPGGEATCTSPQFCTVCGGLLADALGHDYTHAVTEPTCTAVGYTTHSCTRCDHIYRDTYTDVKAHTPGAEATCTKPQLCEVCGKLLNDALGHDYVAAIVPPTCTAKGYTTHTCSRCSDSYTDTPVDAVGHTEGDAPTCTTDQFCTVCGQVLAPKLGHNHLATVTLPPTCTEQGIMTHTCTRCTDSYTRSIAPNGHTPGPEATCIDAQLCTVCNTRLTDKLGHSYGSQLVDPTCDERGYTLHECSRCGSAYIDTPVPAKGHTPGEAATCTEAQTCTVCGTILADKLGHAYDKTVTAPTCLEQGFTTRTCTRCNHTYLSDFQNALGHKAGAKATCTAAQTCTRCAALMAEKLGHTYTDTVVPPTCVEPGYTLHKCDVCKNAYTDTVVEATGHTAGDWIIDRNPGFGEAGKRHLECTVCRVLLESETFLSEEDTTAAEPVTDEDGQTNPTTSDVADREDEEEQGGCGQTAGNILVIVLVLAAAFLFWYIDARRRSR